MMKFLIFCAIVVSVCSIRLSLPTTGLLSSIVCSDGVASSSKESVNCVDGVCSLSSRPADEADLNDNSSLSEKVLSEWASADAPIVANIPASIVPDQKLVTADNVNTLTTMGWSDAEANDALGRFQNDVAKAAQYLEAQDEEIDARQSRLRVLVESGWDQNAAYFVLEKCEGNATAAAEMLENEENRTTSNFNLAVNDMVQNIFYLPCMTCICFMFAFLHIGCQWVVRAGCQGGIISPVELRPTQSTGRKRN